MRCLNVVSVLLLMVPLVGCRTTNERAVREISLAPRGSSLSVKVDVDGRVKIVAYVPPGSPGAGTYTSTDPALQEDATDAKNALNDPGGVTISVDDSGRLIGFGRTASR